MVLPKSMRLKGHKCFDYIHREGARYNNKTLLIKIAPAKPHLESIRSKSNQMSSIKCAVAISKKISKKAVERNRLRRLFHNHLRIKLSGSRFSSPNWALISLKPSCAGQDPYFLLKECDKLLQKAGLVS